MEMTITTVTLLCESETGMVMTITTVTRQQHLLSVLSAVMQAIYANFI